MKILMIANLLLAVDVYICQNFITKNKECQYPKYPAFAGYFGFLYRRLYSFFCFVHQPGNAYPGKRV